MLCAKPSQTSQARLSDLTNMVVGGALMAAVVVGWLWGVHILALALGVEG